MMVDHGDMVIIRSKSADHHGRSNKVRAIKTGKVITYNTKHIWKMPIMIEQNLREQIARRTGHLTDIFTNTDQIREDRTHKPHTSCTQINMHQGDEQEDRVPEQQKIGVPVVIRM